MRSRLFLKIYLTLLASLAAVALASAVFVRVAQDERDSGWRGRRDQFIVAMLPAQADPTETQIVLNRLGQALDADITIFDSAGQAIAFVGKPFTADVLERGHHGDGIGRGAFVVHLDDGRAVAARLGFAFGPQDGRAPLAYLITIAAVIGFVAYPVVRHMTRRLEALRSGVETWGAGALATRVPVKGSDEVAAVAATFNQAADRIERLVAAHRSLLANASHELRSPLARLRLAIDLHEPVADSRTRAEIVTNLAELDSLVEEILLASRLDHAEIAERETVDLLALAAEEAARHDVSVSGSPAWVRGDARLLTRLVRNLIQNALRHGSRPVDIDLQRSGQVLELRVRDHGPGIPAQESERVFEPFYRPPGRSEAAGGWGLGLALVRQIARRHGGDIRIETPADGGACFVVTLPAAIST